MPEPPIVRRSRCPGVQHRRHYRHGSHSRVIHESCLAVVASNSHCTVARGHLMRPESNAFIHEWCLCCMHSGVWCSGVSDAWLRLALHLCTCKQLQLSLGSWRRRDPIGAAWKWCGMLVPAKCYRELQTK